MQQKYLSLEGFTVSIPGQRPGIADSKERLAWRAIRPRRWRREPRLAGHPPVQQKYLSQEGYTVSKSACRNGQSAALLSDSGLVMYFSTLPAPSSSAPCILTILTHLQPGATPPDSRELPQCQPGGLYAREDGGGSRRAKAHSALMRTV